MNQKCHNTNKSGSLLIFDLHSLWTGLKARRARDEIFDCHWTEEQWCVWLLIYSYSFEQIFGLLSDSKAQRNWSPISPISVWPWRCHPYTSKFSSNETWAKIIHCCAHSFKWSWFDGWYHLRHMICHTWKHANWTTLLDPTVCQLPISSDRWWRRPVVCLPFIIHASDRSQTDDDRAKTIR